MESDISIQVPMFSTIYEIYKFLKDGEFKRRLEMFMEHLESNFKILRESHIQHLKESKTFATVFFLSGQIALKTDDIKRVLLADAVTNTLKDDFLEEEIIILFNCFEKYTLSHLSLLNFLQDPKSFITNDGNSRSISSLFHKVCPTVTPELERILVHDLNSDGMLTSDSMFTTISYSGGFEKYTTSLGDKMIKLFNLGRIPQLNEIEININPAIR